MKRVFKQLFIMDKLGIQKEEMHNPYKHIIVDKKGRPWLVDFERASFSKAPKNVTQFCQFLASKEVSAILRDRGIVIRRETLLEMAKNYKKSRSEQSFKAILSLLG